MLFLRCEWSLPTDRDWFQLLLSLLLLNAAFCALLHGAPRAVASKEANEVLRDQINPS